MPAEWNHDPSSLLMPNPIFSATTIRLNSRFFSPLHYFLLSRPAATIFTAAVSAQLPYSEQQPSLSPSQLPYSEQQPSLPLGQLPIWAGWALRTMSCSKAQQDGPHSGCAPSHCVPPLASLSTSATGNQQFLVDNCLLWLWSLVSVFALSTVSGVGGRDGDTISLYQSRMGNYVPIPTTLYNFAFFWLDFFVFRGH